MKAYFTEPTVEVIKLSVEDVITTSSNGFENGFPVGMLPPCD